MLGEFCDIFILRVQNQIAGGADLNDFAVFHDGYSVSQTDRLVEIMGDKHNGFIQDVLESQELVLHFTSDQRIER